MSASGILVSSSNVPLQDAPIHPDWILDGDPRARNCVLSKSADGTAVTLIWDCSAGSFNWFYDTDETIHVLEGGAVLTDASGTREIAAGDVVFFPAGSQAAWRVSHYVRKVAFFRQPVPRSVGLALRAWKRVRGATPARTAGRVPQPVMTLITATLLSLSPILA